MATRQYSKEAIVIRKTKLSESDLILDMISEDSQHFKAIAKSSRKPGNTFSNRCELFNSIYIACANLRTLDIVREAKTITYRKNIRKSYSRYSSASALAELLYRLTFFGNRCDLNYLFIKKTLDIIDSCDTKQLAHITLAHLLKIISMEGFKPQLKYCIECNSIISNNNEGPYKLRFSEGGVVCNKHDNMPYNLKLNYRCLNYMDYLINSKYELILNTKFDLSEYETIDCFHFAEKWISYFINRQINSIQIFLDSYFEKD